MTRHSIEGESLEEIAAELERLDVIRNVEDEWFEIVDVLQRAYEGTRVATERTDGRGRQQGVIAELSGLNEDFSEREVGKMLDLLDAFGLVEHDGRLYAVEH